MRLAQVLLPCVAGFTTGTYRLPTASRQTAASCVVAARGLRSPKTSRFALSMVAAASDTLPSADALKTSQLAQLASMTGSKIYALRVSNSAYPSSAVKQLWTQNLSNG